MKSGDLVFNEQEGVFYKKFTDVPFTGEVTGQRQGKLKNGKKEGPWVYYHKNGKLFSKGTYKDGMNEGPWVSYWGNGKLLSKGTYKNGKREGPWVSVNYKGQLEGKGTYKNGMKNGHWLSDTEESGMYRNGKLVK